MNRRIREVSRLPKPEHGKEKGFPHADGMSLRIRFSAERPHQFAPVVRDALTAGNCGEVKRMTEAAFGKEFACMGNHDRIIRAEEAGRQQEALARAVGELLHGGADLRIGGDTACDDDSADMMVPFLFEGPLHLQRKGFGHGEHVGCTDIAQSW